MSEEMVEKGCMRFAFLVITTILGAGISGAAGMFFGKNMVIAGICFFVGGAVANGIYRAWWDGMVRSQRNPIVAAVIFLIMALALMASLVFFVVNK